jgi:putative inorganic carbon (HCO3(-)) transporter
MIQNLAQRIASFELWLVGALVLASLFWSQLLIVAVVTLFLFGGIHKLAYGYFSLRTPVDWGVLLLVCTALISTAISYLPQITTVQVLRLFSGVALFYAVINWALTLKRINLLLVLVLILSMGLALFALVSVEWSFAKLHLVPATFSERLTILVVDTANPNVMAGNLVLFAPIAFSLMVFYALSPGFGKYQSVIYIFIVLAFSLITAVIVMTLSRTAWIAYSLAIALICILRWRRGWMAVLALCILGIGYLFIFPPSGLTETLLASQGLGSVAGRLEVWTRAIFMIQDFPVTGIGMGTYKDLAVMYYPFSSVSVDRITHAHNLYLQIALDLGLPGLVAWLSVMLGVILVSAKLYRAGIKSGQRWWAALGAGYLGSMLALMIGGLFDAVTWGGVRPAPIVWMLWGCVIAFWHYTVGIESGS